MDSGLRFKKYVEKFGFRIDKVAYRPDLLAVKYMNQYLFAIPKKMYDRKFPLHMDMTGWGRNTLITTSVSNGLLLGTPRLNVLTSSSNPGR